MARNFSVGTFSVGAQCALRGLSSLTKPGIRQYVVIPLLINTLVFTGALWWATTALAPLIGGWVEAATAWLPDWLNWLASILVALLWLIFGAGALVAVFYTFSTIANLLASPFNGLLAEKVEHLHTGTVSDTGISIWREIAVAPAQEIRKMLYFLVWAIPFLILFLIPGINIAAPFLWAAFSAWMLSLQYVDYPLGNRGLRFVEQRAMMRNNRQLSLGFGAVVLVLTMIPVVNFVAMPAAVIGATYLALDHLRN
jgi:CysZ protein